MPFEAEITRDDLLTRIAAHPMSDTPALQRPAFQRLMLGGAAVAPGMRHIRARRAGGPRVIWFHGGGYVFGSPATHERIGVYLANRHGFDVTLPAYRLAPEHPWPAQLDDALAAIPEDGKVVLAGDSAGGHLALVTALHLARAGRPPLGLLLFSPNTDRSGRSVTRTAMEAGDPMVGDAGDRALAEMCFGARPLTDPDVSPLLADLSGLSPTWIEVGTPEVLLDDSRLLHARAREVGVDAHLTVTHGMLHMGQVWTPWWAPARASLDRAAAFATGIWRQAGTFAV
ncbi:alpha/beta hydrolase [uncultured Jannaschia sp.]|uniref:alpha/beta hydrolase n=1 Tax=uncultured Jannaschia sp. TaxID=293347 RepID=UPI00262B7D8F|nr:alpha/beta hydrolase [uncultured Jannaschia sp.]